MAIPRDNMDEEMMDIINTDTQFANGDQQDVDDGSQYLALENNQENIVTPQVLSPVKQWV